MPYPHLRGHVHAHMHARVHAALALALALAHPQLEAVVLASHTGLALLTSTICAGV